MKNEINKLKGGRADKINNLRDLCKYWSDIGYKNGGVSKSLYQELEQQINLGTQIEREYTSNEEKITEIVFDHLIEDKDYYTKAKPKNWW